MEEKTMTASTRVKELYKKYRNSMLDCLMCPKAIPTINKEEAYFNLNKRKQNNIEAKKRNLLMQIKPAKKGNLSDDNKGQKVATKREKENYNNQSDSQNYIRIQEVPDKVNFGSQSDYSFFEYWSKEIVFQMVNYHSKITISKIYHFENPPFRKNFLYKKYHNVDSFFLYLFFKFSKWSFSK